MFKPNENIATVFLILSAALNAITCNTVIQSQTAQPSSLTKPMAAVSPTPSATLPSDAALRNETQESERVTEFGKQTGGKTIRVEFVPSQSNTEREKTWIDNGVQIKARFTSQSAKYQTVWAQGTTDVYLINAQAGQKLKVNVKAIEQKDMREAELKQTATLGVYNARTNEPLAGGNDYSWSGQLPETGDYAITVICAHGGTKYDLEIAVK